MEKSKNKKTTAKQQPETVTETKEKVVTSDVIANVDAAVVEKVVSREREELPIYLL